MTTPASSFPETSLPPLRVPRFRKRLLLAMALLVALATAIGIVVVDQDIEAGARREMDQAFRAELEARRDALAVRDAALAELCRALVRKPRIRAALEDNALDLLYPVARDELRDVLDRADRTSPLKADFCRFLDPEGRVIVPQGDVAVGALPAADAAPLALPGLSSEHQVGFLVSMDPDGHERLHDVIAMPIQSSETGEVIAALVLGFPRPVAAPDAEGPRVLRGVYSAGGLRVEGLDRRAASDLEARLKTVIGDAGPGGLEVLVDGRRHRLFHQRMNAGSRYPAAFEVDLFPLEDLEARRRTRRWQVLTAGLAMLLGGLGISHVLAGRLTVPVAALAAESEEQRSGRLKAEAELQLSREGTVRAARFSSDASHQLKTPVTVLRSGLEELRSRPGLAPEMREELSDLIHQTYRLSSIIDDLLLLARADAGRLQVACEEVDLSHLLEAGVDDLGALADESGLEIRTEIPPGLRVAGESRYLSVVLQNLLENARKYNRPSGRIGVVAAVDGDRVRVRVGNTGRTLPEASRERIFERFHRGVAAEDVPGHGLGLNLARELARLQGGELRLLRSGDDWTEFEVVFRRWVPGASRSEVTA